MNTMPRRRWVQHLLLMAISSTLPVLLTPKAVHAATRPALMLPKVYRAGIALALADYGVSEKYDGVRGYWDGQQLWTRGGQRINAPRSFTADWPTEPMDGELWAGHGAFARAVSTVRQQTPDDAAWKQLSFMVFDLPAHPGPFAERLIALQQLVDRLSAHAITWVKPVAQTTVADDRELQALLKATVQSGGEGLMLHRQAALYRGQRSDDLLKLKPYDDAEARVVALVPGRGKYEGMMGALQVEMANGQRFKLGTGFTDSERQHPPEVGAWVTYRFRDMNPSGVPRFASFLRVAPDPDY